MRHDDDSLVTNGPPAATDGTARARTFGPTVRDGGTLFRLWSPGALSVGIEVDDRARPLKPVGHGFWEIFVPGVGPGSRYAFDVDGRLLADPASRRQADTIDGPSIVVDTSDFARPGRIARPWVSSAIVEVHVGTATAAGTFRALIDRLDHWRDVGFTAVQLMPVNDFPGRWNWGYDGVLPFAPARAYGSPEDLVALIDAAHARGLSIYLDVVYNHFGPSGNVLHTIAPSFFDEGEPTPWGAAIDFRKEPVRRFFVENVRMWVEDYGFDGLRFDAVHAYLEEARSDFLRELMQEVATLDPRPHLIAENEHNSASYLGRDGSGVSVAFDAQWNDDFHNALHVILTGETEGYYRAYADDPVGILARCLAEGFYFQGEDNPLRPGHVRGEPSAHLPPAAFVDFVQNHDQIGNRPLGDPLSQTLSVEQLAFTRFLLLTAPQIPMMFMGEEWATTRPFPFFCDFEGDLADVVRAGRRAEFKDFPGFSGDIPDPLSAETVESARRDWDSLATPGHAEALADTRMLLARRADRIVPLLLSGRRGADAERVGSVVAVRWRFAAGDLTLVLNLGGDAAFIPPHTADRLRGDEPFARCGPVDPSDAGLRLGAWSASAWIQP